VVADVEQADNKEQPRKGLVNQASHKAGKVKMLSNQRPPDK
jgi:hypothetical protein